MQQDSMAMQLVFSLEAQNPCKLKSEQKLKK